MSRPTRLLAAGVAALALCVGPAALEASAAAAPPMPPSAKAASDTYESSVITQANQQRAQHDKRGLKGSSCVDGFAERQAKAMASKHAMFHQPMGPILKQCRLNLVGENVAYGFDGGPAVTKAWMNSPGHRANLLKTDYRLIGVGAVKDDRGVWYVSQVFGRSA